MKGVVFTEFLEMVEDAFSMEVADRIIEMAKLESGGAYTSVGSYPHTEMLALVKALSQITGEGEEALVQTFGQHLFGRFVELYPAFFNGVEDSYSFLSRVHEYVHTEVLKLYPEAELPHFSHEIVSPNKLIMVYRSKRPFAPLAEGLIRGCVGHFKEEVEIVREDLQSEPEVVARFTLTRQS